MNFTAAQIATQVQGEVIGDGTILLSGLAAAAGAKAGEITFAEKDSYFAAAEASAASAILVAGAFTSSTKVLIRVRNARVAAAQVLELFFPVAHYAPAIHSSAIVDPTAKIDPTAHIGPNCVIGAGTIIGARVVLIGGNHLGSDCRVGDDTRLYPHVVLYAGTQLGRRVAIHAGTVIGADGYGYVFDQGRHRKIPQVGNIIIHDDVEIGANCTMDRAALSSTIIGEGCKIDNLVHFGHNVIFGKHCLVMGQCGIAGSTQFGDYCVIASQTGVTGHLKIGRQVTVGGKSGVTRDVADGETVMGFPAVPDKQAKRQWIGIQKLPEMILRMRELEKQVAALTARLG
ncbi:MAG: UDP-3-O-(3-hydroxymyristoyl)glucosamine N-acyltransferase [Opitutaceae bacterium]|nr:UDP-3-O-(3-hydroxymyristoyl)glucosamine N-acyltransferase [Opitutaceae bacterium]NBR58059.1 UDP-3-O-(3-hydroxymyristoyl)glucosamine N-acyltransferase [Opitutaceae bacterium]